MATLESVLADVNAVGKRVFNNPNVVMTAATTAKDVPEWDSLNHTVLISEIEQHFRIKFSLKEVMKFKNVGDMCSTICAKVG